VDVLILQSNPGLGRLWQRHVERLGRSVILVHDQDSAVEVLQRQCCPLIVLDIDLADGAALAVSDYASYRCPSIKIVFVTSSSFFSDGSIFFHAANACAYLGASTAPEDLAVLVDHYAASS
jgi:CheY-like chemotaxis protein